MSEQNNGNQADLDAGKYDCWAASNKARIVDVRGERKAIVMVVVDYEGTNVTRDTWHTLDPKAVTSGGKRRIQFTIDALTALGAVDPMRDIGLALKNDPSASEVEIEGLGGKVAVLVVKPSQTGAFMNYDVWSKREPVSAGFADDLLSLSAGGKKAAKGGAKVNPFAPRGSQVTPPPARPGVGAAQGDESFPYGGSAPARPA